MKDLGHLKYFLGLEVAFSSRGYLLSQFKYASDLITRARLTDDKVVDTPLELNVKMRPTYDEPLSDPTHFRQLVGSFISLTISRPDIAHAVHVVSQFMTAPRTVHLAAVHRIIKYIRGTLSRVLFLPSTSSLQLRAYADADWAGDPTDRRSTTGFCIFLGDSLISWRCKKQEAVARSTAEAEYRAMAHATAEIVWLRWLLSDLGVHLQGPTPLYCDNKSAMQIASHPVFHERTKHIEVDCHYVRKKFIDGTLSLPYVSSSMQLADFFTLSHTIARQTLLVGKLSMISLDPS